MALNQYKQQETPKDILTNLKKVKESSEIQGLINKIDNKQKDLKNLLTELRFRATFSDFKKTVSKLIELYDKDPSSFSMRISDLYSTLINHGFSSFNEKLNTLITINQIPVPPGVGDWFLMGMSPFFQQPFVQRLGSIPIKPYKLSTPFDQQEQQVLYGDLAKSFILGYDVQAWPFSLIFPGRFLGLTRRFPMEYPLSLSGYLRAGSLHNLHFDSGVVNQGLYYIDTAHLWTGLKIIEDIVINQAAINYIKIKDVPPDLSAKLDLLFRKEGQVRGDMLVFLENKRYGIFQGYYYDGKSWVALDLFMKDGKIVTGGSAQGVFQGSLAGAFNYNRLGNDDLFYVVLYSDDLKTGVAAQKDPHQRMISLLHNFNKLSIEAGYFTLESGALGKNVDKAEGGLVGLGGEDFHARVYAASEHNKVNILGLAAAIKQRTFVSTFVRADDAIGKGKITHGNLSFSTSQQIGDTTVTLSTTQIASEEGKPKSQGAIEVKVGKGSDATFIRLGYDGINPPDFMKQATTFFNQQNITDTISLINAINALLLHTNIQNFPYPLAQVEVEDKSIQGKISLSKLKEGGYGLSYTGKDIFGLEEISPSLAITKQGAIATVSFGIKDDEKLVLQLGKENVALGAKIRIDERILVGTFSWEKNAIKATIGHYRNLTKQTRLEGGVAGGKDAQGKAYGGGQISVFHKTDITLGNLTLRDVQLGGTVGWLNRENINYAVMGVSVGYLDILTLGGNWMFSPQSPASWFIFLKYGFNSNFLQGQ